MNGPLLIIFPEQRPAVPSIGAVQSTTSAIRPTFVLAPSKARRPGGGVLPIRPPTLHRRSCGHGHQLRREFRQCGRASRGRGSPALCSAEEHAVSALRPPWIPPCAPHRPYQAAGKCSTLPNRYSWLLACSLVSRYSHTRFTAAREGGRSSVRYETVAVGHCTTVG